MIEDLRSQHLTRERARKALTARSPHPTSTRAAHVGWSGARPVYAHNPAYRFEAHPIATWAHCHACCRCRKVKGSGRGGKDFICARNQRASLAVPYRFPRYTPRLLLLKTAPLYRSSRPRSEAHSVMPSVLSVCVLGMTEPRSTKSPQPVRAFPAGTFALTCTSSTFAPAGLLYIMRKVR